MNHHQMPVIYVAAPFTAPTLFETAEWTHRTKRWARALIDVDAAPLIPHTAYGLEFVGLKTPQFWYDATLSLMRGSNGLVVLATHRDDGTPSQGVLAEMDMALKWGLPMFCPFNPTNGQYVDPDEVARTRLRALVESITIPTRTDG